MEDCTTWPHLVNCLSILEWAKENVYSLKWGEGVVWPLQWGLHLEMFFRQRLRIYILATSNWQWRIYGTDNFKLLLYKCTWGCPSRNCSPQLEAHFIHYVYLYIFSVSVIRVVCIPYLLCPHFRHLNYPTPQGTISDLRLHCIMSSSNLTYL